LSVPIVTAADRPLASTDASDDRAPAASDLPSASDLPGASNSPPARNSQGFLSKSALWVVIARAWSVIATALLGILLPRWFGVNVAGCGEVLLLINLVGFAGMVASFGLPETMIRLVAERLARGQEHSLRPLLQRCWQLLALTSLVVAGATALFFWLIGFRLFNLPGSLLLAVVVAAAILALSWQMVGAAIIRGFHEVRWANLLSGGQSGGPIAVTMFLIALAGLFLSLPHAAVTSTVVAQLLMGAILVTAVITFWRLSVVMHVQSVETVTDGVPSVAELFLDAFPLAMSQITAFCTLSADLWLTSSLLGTEEVAYYGNAKRLVLFLGIPEQLAMLTIIAIIPDLYARGKMLDLQRMIRQATTLAAIPAVLAAAALVLLPKTILGIAFGPQYQVAAGVLVILALGQVVANLLGPCGYVLLMTGRRWTVLLITFVCGVNAIVCGAIGARYGGMMGLAIAAAFSTAAQITLEWLAVRYYLGIWCHASPAALLAGRPASAAASDNVNDKGD
jgi:O-antigen/teichoic acid export membrane protein